MGRKTTFSILNAEDEIQLNGTRMMNELYAGSATLDPSSIAASGTDTATITVTGAAVGDFVIVAPGVDLQGLIHSAYVSAANTVEIALFNPTVGAVDLASSTWNAIVFSRG